MNALISVIICTYKRPEFIPKVLESLVSQEINGSFDMEVLVIDNDPNGSARQAVARMESKLRGHLRYIHEPARGKSNALNRGIREAKGDIIAFTDDDVILDRKWLLSLARCFQETGCDCVGDRVLPGFPESTPQWVRENLDLLCGPIVYHDYL